MKPVGHIIVSFSIGLTFWLVTRHVYASIVCFLSGLFLDADHIAEYIFNHGWRGLNLKNLLEACDQTSKRKGERKFQKIHLIFHSAELSLLLWFLAFHTLNIYIFAFAIGYFVHLLFDCIINKEYPWFYFILWRAKNKFDSKCILREKQQKEE